METLITKRVLACAAFLFLALLSAGVYGQQRMKPRWTVELPMASEAGEFRTSVGEGKTLRTAKQEAIMGYIRERNFELGLTVSTEGMETLYADTESDISDEGSSTAGSEKEGINQGTRLKSDENRIRFRVAETHSRDLPGGLIRVWCLIWQPEEGQPIRPPKLQSAKYSKMLMVPDPDDYMPLPKGQRVSASRGSSGGYVPLPGAMRPFRYPGLAWLAPGAAHLYNKRYAKGFTFLLGSAALVTTGIATMSYGINNGEPVGAMVTSSLSLIANFGLYIWNLADAYVSARDAKRSGANQYAQQGLTFSPWMAQVPMGYGNGEMATGVTLRYGF